MSLNIIDTQTLDTYHTVVEKVCEDVRQRFALQKYIPNTAMLKRMLSFAGIEEHMMDEAIEEVLQATGKTIEQ